MNHQKAATAKLAHSLKENQKATPIERVFRSHEQIFVKMDKLLGTAYYLVKKEKEKKLI